MSDAEAADISVLYNASCPICGREIDHYARITDEQALSIRYDDLNDPDALRRWGIDRTSAAKRLHVRANGTIVSGVPAFALLWQKIPRYRWLAWLVTLPGLKQIASLVYDWVMAPALYRWHRMRAG